MTLLNLISNLTKTFPPYCNVRRTCDPRPDCEYTLRHDTHECFRVVFVLAWVVSKSISAFFFTLGTWWRALLHIKIEWSYTHNRMELKQISSLYFSSCTRRMVFIWKFRYVLSCLFYCLLFGNKQLCKSKKELYE